MTVVSIDTAGLHVASVPAPPPGGVLDGVVVTVAGDWMPNPSPQTNDCWVWDGSQEIPASVSVWDGTQEIPASLAVA